MSIFIFILLAGILIFFLFLGLLVWQVKTGQMDDLVTPSEKILWEDPKND